MCRLAPQAARPIFGMECERYEPHFFFLRIESRHNKNSATVVRNTNFGGRRETDTIIQHFITRSDTRKHLDKVEDFGLTIFTFQLFNQV